MFAIDGGRDVDFLSRIFDKLLVNFTWWVNLQDADGCNLFEGGFLGLDNIGPLDRSHLPPGGVLEQSDATGWMATYALSMGVIAEDPPTAPASARRRPGAKFLEHFAAIRGAINTQGLWDEADGLFYDGSRLPDGSWCRSRSARWWASSRMLAAAVVDEQVLERAQAVGKHFARLPRPGGAAGPRAAGQARLAAWRARPRQLLLGVVGIDRLERLFEKLFDRPSSSPRTACERCPPITANTPTSWR